MRPIDADYLKDVIRAFYEYEYPTASGDFDKFVINQLPVLINAIPECKSSNAGTQRLATRIYDRPGHWYCSECKTMFGRACFVYKHCYNCGAKFEQLLECAYYEDGRCLGTKWIDSVQCEGKKRFCIYNK